MATSIFVVDSSPAVRRMVEQISTPEGFEVVGFQDGPTALEAARRISPALIIADYHLDNMTFSGFCKEVNKLDNLTETYLISLINPADRPDENHLRTLGVKAFLKKPFQSEDLLDVIKSLQQNQQRRANGQGLRRRVWPPTSATTDSDEDGELLDRSDIFDGQEDRAMDHSTESSSTTPATRQQTAEPEEAMKGLFGQLLESLTARTERRLSDLLPQAIEEKVASLVRPIVQLETERQLDVFLSQDRLAAIIRPLLAQELPHLIRTEIAACEPIIRQAVADLAGPIIRDTAEQMVRERTESAVREHLTDAVRGHLGAIELVVKEEIKQATLKQAPLLADDIVRGTAEHIVEQAVQRIVPGLAEQHIMAELKRLTDAADPRDTSAV